MGIYLKLGRLHSAFVQYIPIIDFHKVSGGNHIPMHEKEYQDHIQDHTCSYRPSGDQNSHKSKPSIGFQYRMLLTLANNIFLRLDLPELKHLWQVEGMSINMLTCVPCEFSRVFMSKFQPELGQNRKIEGPYICYMSSQNKMLLILLYQLFVPNKKAFLQFLCQRPLDNTF